MTQRQAAIWAFAISQTLGYACLYYIFAALVTDWQADLGWSKPQLAMGPTLAIVIAGGLAPIVGRFIDRGWSRALLSGGAVVGALALALLATASSQATYLFAWALIGLAQAAALYEACFAVLVRRLGPQARAAIIRVTLVAGFASTLAFPTAALVSGAYGWRSAVWLAFGLVLFVQLPLNYWGTSVFRRGELPPTAQGDADAKSALHRALRSVEFWLLGAVLGLLSLNHWMLIAYIVPIFRDLGASLTWAVTAAACVGPAQVGGRLILMRFDARLGNWSVMILCLCGMALGCLMLIIAGAAPWAIFAFALLQGAAIGIMTILRPVLIADVLGKDGYGAIAGSLQVMPLLAGAAAPMVGGLLFQAGGAHAVIWVSAGVIALAFGGTLLLRRL